MIRDDSPPFGSGDVTDMQQLVSVLDAQGKQLGIMTLSEAKKIAERDCAKLVKISATLSPPVYRLIGADEYKKHIKTRKMI